MWYVHILTMLSFIYKINCNLDNVFNELLLQFMLQSARWNVSSRNVFRYKVLWVLKVSEFKQALTYCLTWSVWEETHIHLHKSLHKNEEYGIAYHWLFYLRGF